MLFSGESVSLRNNILPDGIQCLPHSTLLSVFFSSSHTVTPQTYVPHLFFSFTERQNVDSTKPVKDYLLNSYSNLRMNQLQSLLHDSLIATGHIQHCAIIRRKDTSLRASTVGFSVC